MGGLGGILPWDVVYGGWWRARRTVLCPHLSLLPTFYPFPNLPIPILLPHLTRTLPTIIVILHHNHHHHYIRPICIYATTTICHLPDVCVTAAATGVAILYHYILGRQAVYLPAIPAVTYTTAYYILLPHNQLHTTYLPYRFLYLLSTFTYAMSYLPTCHDT